jgi:hypothetical protein
MQQSIWVPRLLPKQKISSMKKILTLVILAIAVGQVNATRIDPKTPVGISVLKLGNVCKLFYRAEQRGDVHVSIYNQKGSVVFSEVIRKTDNFMRPYNFSALPHGTYTIELNDGQRTRSEKVEHRISPGRRVATLLRVNKDDNRYLLAIPNKGHDVLTIRIFDERNTLLFEGREAVDGDFAKVYNLSGVRGTPMFEVADREGRISRLVKSSVR